MHSISHSPPSHHSLYSIYAIGAWRNVCHKTLNATNRFACLGFSQPHNIRQSTPLREKNINTEEQRSWPWWSTANSKWSLKYFPAKARCTRLYIQHLSVQPEVAQPWENERNHFCNTNINCFLHAHYFNIFIMIIYVFNIFVQLQKPCNQLVLTNPFFQSSFLKTFKTYAVAPREINYTSTLRSHVKILFPYGG